MPERILWQVDEYMGFPARRSSCFQRTARDDRHQPFRQFAFHLVRTCAGASLDRLLDTAGWGSRIHAQFVPQ
jgi:hypothetical protein